MFLTGKITAYILSLFKLNIIEAGVLLISRSVGACDACRNNVYRFSRLESMFRTRQLARLSACCAGTCPESDEVTDRIFQRKYLPDVEIRGISFYDSFVRIVFQSHAEYFQGKVCHFLPFLPQKTAGGIFLPCLLFLDIEMDGVIYLRNLYKTFLLGDAWGELISNPTDISRVDAKDFVKEMPVIFTDGNNVVSSALHAFGIVFHQ